MEFEKAMAGVSLFKGLPEEDLKLLSAIVKRRSFQRGEIIFSEGDEGDGFYVVVDGMVEVFKLSPDGKKQILHLLGPGEPFGEVAVFEGRAFPAHASALRRAEVLFFPREAFLRLIKEHPSLVMRMLGVMARRLREFASMIENLSLKEASSRLAGYLLHLQQRQGASRELELEVSKGQLANFLGTAPETLSRVLNRLTREGLIEVEGKRFRLIDLEGLRQLAMNPP